jgi:hypothetical protein
MLAHAFIFGGQYNTISQIARLLTAFYLAYIGTNNDLLPESIRKICKFASVVYFGIVLAVAVINSTELLHS